MNSVSKPIQRSKFRQFVGKEYFCLKEKINWRIEGVRFSKQKQEIQLPFEIFKHQSILLRELRDVDMQLQRNKITNLKLAIERINGIIIQPGETFSVWKLVGRPTQRKGYLPGLTLSNGRLGEGVGGGLCQLGNLLYWMAIHSQLTVTKRWRHSYDVFPDSGRTLPFGSGATLSYNYIDLHLRNETNLPFQINLSLTEKNLIGSICCSEEPQVRYEVFEKNHRFDLQWWGGYTRHNEIWRKLINSTNEIEGEEMLTENHAIMMYNPLIN